MAFHSVVRREGLLTPGIDHDFLGALDELTYDFPLFRLLLTKTRFVTILSEAVSTDRPVVRAGFKP
jgi:hypothetical protein